MTTYKVKFYPVAEVNLEVEAESYQEAVEKVKERFDFEDYLTAGAVDTGDIESYSVMGPDGNEGSAVAPEIVPDLLAVLGEEPAFQGREFKTFGLKRGEDAGSVIDFVLSTEEKAEL